VPLSAGSLLLFGAHKHKLLRIPFRQYLDDFDSHSLTIRGKLAFSLRHTLAIAFISHLNQHRAVVPERDLCLPAVDRGSTVFAAGTAGDFCLPIATGLD
jgi:hypothetical protein